MIAIHMLILAVALVSFTDAAQKTSNPKQSGKGKVQTYQTPYAGGTDVGKNKRLTPAEHEALVKEEIRKVSGGNPRLVGKTACSPNGSPPVKKKGWNCFVNS